MKDRNKLLVKAYSKNVKRLNKNLFTDNTVGLLLFVEYIRYIRDSYIIKNNDTTQIRALAAALAEFNAYNTSEDSEKKLFHWNNFWELIKTNLEEWIKPDDSI